MRTWLLGRVSNRRYNTISSPDACPPQPPPARTTKWLYLAVFTVTLGNFSFGYSMVYSSPALKQLNETSDPHLHLDETNKSWFASLYSLGAAFGGLVTICLNSYLGRKKIILVSILPSAAGFAVMAGAQTVWMLDLGRALTGISGGITVASISVYVSEISTVEVRGALGAGAQIMTVIGSLLLYLLALGLSWRWLAGLGLVAPVIMFVLLLFMPESPRYLISKKRNEEAVRALAWLRGSAADCSQEYTEISQAARENTETASCAELLKPGVYKPVLIVVTMWGLQQLSGITVVLLYMESIFYQTQVVMSGKADSVIVGAVRLLAVMITAWLLDRTGRRKLLFASGVFMFASMLAMGLYIRLLLGEHRVTGNVTVTQETIGHFSQQVIPAGLTYIPLVSVIAMVFGFSLGWGPITWLMTSEMLPIQVRGKVSGFCVLFSWLLSFMITNLFLTVQKHLGRSVPFFFFAAVSMFSLVFTAVFIPETMGRTLEEIEDYFLNKNADTRANNDDSKQP